ncbi:DUF4349 domain-containing protein [Alkalibaculum sp. M08DMB]|uniref:DUF4349 domain-containing protein n=1 Tax=Alkalibaculum sporogenes TaxID=2655001 RepID=A0A6A7K5C4_9FIRM|nr:DUF4349 domain-containing protein [Alkalibaculum sporogenes]MPW24585.1 DUF4349 domain-containing protein [Alkalibaculum sporogenes]
MDCKRCNELISDNIDNKISNWDKEEMDKHLKSCRKCSNNFRITKEIVDSLNQLEEVKPPQDFSANVIKEIKTGKGNKKMSFKRFLSYAAVLVCGVFVTAIVLQWPFSKNDYYSSDTMAMQEESAYRTMGDLNGAEITEDKLDSDLGITDGGEMSYNNVFDRDKIIYHGDINLDVKDSEKASKDIRDYIEAQGGFIENSYSNKSDENRNEPYTNHSYIVFRVPASKFNQTMEKLKEFGEETSTNINSTNVSTQYRDIESEKQSLEIQEDRLLNYLKEAKKVEDMITIESELNRVRTNLNRLNTELTNYDRLIDYSNITVNLRESKTLTTTIKSPFGQLIENISKGFISSINLLLQSIAFIIVLTFRLIPFLVILLPIAWVIKKYVLKR